MSFIDPERVKPLKVVLDGGNGMAGPMAGPLLDRLPIEAIETYWEPDGNFPDHEPNPLSAREPPVRDRPRAAPRAPTWGSRGTATRTAASSSTTRASSSTATS